MAKLIYVADDEANICFLIQNFLEKEGFAVQCFGVLRLERELEKPGTEVRYLPIPERQDMGELG